MNSRKMNYASAVSLCAAVSILIVTMSDYYRVEPAFLGSYLILKAFFVFSTASFSLYFYRNEATDKSAAFFVINLLVFVLSMMWYLPLYEIAYFQSAILAAFLRFKNRWIFPSLFFAGFLGVLGTYRLQDEIAWDLPPIIRSDWIFTVFLFFILAWCIQKFSIHAQSQARDRLLRFSIIGKETTRLIHDLKGLLSSPLLILESFRDKESRLTPEHQEKQISLLIEDMDHVRETIKSIHRLVTHEDQTERLALDEVIQGSMKILERRLVNVDIQWPHDSFIVGKKDRLHSVFFNLFLNSLEAFERNVIREQRKIEIFWRENTLVFQDNAGGLKTVRPPQKKESGSGLGLELVRSDLVQMNARFKIKSKPPYTSAEISFGE